MITTFPFALPDSTYANAKYATIQNYDRNFNLVKVKRYGNQGTNNASIVRVNRLCNGKFIVAGFVETANLQGVNLMLFKLNNDLELVD